MNTALFSLETTQRFNEAKLDSEGIQLLKGCAILYPAIVLFAAQNTITNLVEEISKGLPTKRIKTLKSFFLPIDKIDLRWRKPRSSFEILKDIETWLESDTDADLNSVRHLARDYITKQEITHPAFALSLSVSLGIPYHDEAQRLEKLIKVLQDAKPKVASNVELSLTLPDLNQLSWDEILELRDSNYIDRFRIFLHGNIRPDTSSVDIASTVNEALWNIIGKTSPSPSGSLVSRAVGTIPLPLNIPNPWAIYRDVKDGIKERSLFVDYGWIYFMQEVKSKVANSSKNAE